MPRPKFRDKYPREVQDGIVDFLQYALAWAERGETSTRIAWRQTKQQWVRRNWEYYRNAGGAFRWALSLFPQEMKTDGEQLEPSEDRSRVGHTDRDEERPEGSDELRGISNGPRPTHWDDPVGLAEFAPDNTIVAGSEGNGGNRSD